MSFPAFGKIIDITVPISPSTRVFPGDPEPSIESVCTLEADGCAVSRLSFGSHTGTHVDAPSHVLKNGKPVDNLELESLMGRAVILDFSLKTGALSRDMLEYAFRNASCSEGCFEDVTVLLFKTKNPGSRAGAGSCLDESGSESCSESDSESCSEPDSRHASGLEIVNDGENGELEESVYLEEGAAAWIVNNRFATVGIDRFSVDSLASENLPAHHILLSNRVNIVECLDLSPVEAGNYFFICLPLKILGCDGAPARAVLIQESGI